MKKLYKTSVAIVLVSLWVLSGCGSDDDDSTPAPVEDLAAFDFRTDEPAAFTRVDRSGMPAVSTALIQSKDAYNAANPTDDIAGAFVPEILGTLTALHGALDSQLTDLGLTPCTVVGDGTGSCATVAVPLITPDTIKIDTSNTAGFPNGRLLTDPAIAITLAVSLLELAGDAPNAIDALVGVVNPTANDKELLADFPFLATPFLP